MKAKKSVSKAKAGPISNKDEAAKKIMVQYVINPKNPSGPKVKIITET